MYASLAVNRTHCSAVKRSRHPQWARGRRAPTVRVTAEGITAGWLNPPQLQTNSFELRLRYHLKGAALPCRVEDARGRACERAEPALSNSQRITSADDNQEDLITIHGVRR